MGSGIWMVEQIGFVNCSPRVTGLVLSPIINPRRAGIRQYFLRYVRRNQSKEIRVVV